MELSNVLSTWSYRDNKNNFERRRMIATRERTRRLRHWLFHEYELIDASGRVIDYKEEFYWPYLVQWAHVLYSYKKAAEATGTYHRELGKKGGNVRQMAVVLAAVFIQPKRLKELYLTTKITATSFAWGGPRFGVRKSSPTGGNNNNEYCESFLKKCSMLT
jgi:hypothetical protein